MVSQQRYAHIDLGAGVMILWMIIYHALIHAWAFDIRECWGITNVIFPEGAHAFINDRGNIEVLNPCVLFPYLSFFMPWFFYKSGQFFEKRDSKELLAKDSRKLLLTFAIWSAIGYALYLLFGVLQHSLTLRNTTYSIVRGFFFTGNIPINEPLWFLTTLFGVRFVANIFLPDRDEKYGWWKIVTIVVVGFVLVYICYLWNHRLLPYWVANGASGLVFFALGYSLRECENKWWLIVPCAIVYIICCFVGFPMVDMIYNKLLAGNYLLWMPVAFCGIITFNTICRFTCKYISIRSLEIVGQNAMTIYVTHILILLTIQFVITYFEITTLYPHMLWMYLVGYVVFLPLLCRFVPNHQY